MGTVAEGLVLVIRSLPKADKGTVVALLLEDADIRESMAEHLFGKPAKPWGGGRADEYRPGPENGLEAGVGFKERGKRLRESYVAELRKKGIRIDQVGGVWGRTSVGLWVAIPFATERMPDRWFLGLPEDKVRERIGKGGVVVVLLCQLASGGRLDFVIPPHILKDIVPKLSKSDGHLLFNLKKLGNSYQLLMPGISPLDVSDHKGKVSIFQS